MICQIINVVTAKGDLDFRETREIAHVIAELAEHGENKIVVDWGEVDCINPLAIGVLLSRTHALRHMSGEIKFSRMSEFVKKIFWRYGVDHFVENYASIEEAIVSFDEDWGGDGTVQ